eukprot:4617172-Prymnesium_polylepis.1
MAESTNISVARSARDSHATSGAGSSPAVRSPTVATILPLAYSGCSCTIATAASEKSKAKQDSLGLAASSGKS